MQVIFTRELSGFARKNQIKEVNDGYAKNFLIAKGFAIQATPQLINKLKNEQVQEQQKIHNQRQQAEHLKQELDKRTFTIQVKVSDKNKVFGSVHEKTILLRIKEKMNIELDKRQIILPQHLKEPGEYQIQIKLEAGIIATPRIRLVSGQNG